jgi:hypothetical protein
MKRTIIAILAGLAIAQAAAAGDMVEIQATVIGVYQVNGTCAVVVEYLGTQIFLVAVSGRPKEAAGYKSLFSKMLQAGLLVTVNIDEDLDMITATGGVTWFMRSAGADLSIKDPCMITPIVSINRELDREDNKYYYSMNFMIYKLPKGKEGLTSIKGPHYR